MVQTSPKRGALGGIAGVPAASGAQAIQLGSRVGGQVCPVLFIIRPAQALSSAPLLVASQRQRPIRRAVRVKTVQRVPRPLSQAQVAALLAQLRSNRDRAIVLLMLQGGLRPGEVLGLHLEDIAYGRRRVVVRHRDDHPKGARSKSRYERVVDLHEPETLAIVSAYVMDERPADCDSPLVFLIGGGGARRLEALSYDGL